MGLIESHRTENGAPRVEVLPVREQLRQPLGRKLQKGDRIALGYQRHWRPASLQRIVDKLPAEWVDCDRMARAAALHRVKEWTGLFGGLSSGVCRLLMRAAEADADAQYFRVLAEKRDDDKMRGRADQRLTTARQCELMAWEIACRECDRRPKGGPGQAAVLEAELADGLADSGRASALDPGGGSTAGAPTAKPRRTRKKKPVPPIPESPP